MSDITVKQGDFILITDQDIPFRYLKIGEVTNIEYFPDGDIMEYVVKFGEDPYSGKEDFQRYNYDLPYMCKVLKFETR